jgi:hypothetical protein
MADFENQLNISATARIPMSMKGVYATPRPPRGFKFDKATPEDLAKFGFSWVKMNPQALAALQRLADANKLKWIQPELVVDPHKIHLRGSKGRRGVANDPLTTNWAGGVVFAKGTPTVPVPGRRIDGYSTEFNSQQHINFIRTDGHVFELVYSGGGWSLNDLTQFSGGPAAVVDGPIDGYPSNFNEQQHVNFLGTENHVHELFYSGGQWQHNDLMVAAGAPNANPDTALVGYVTEFNQQQHVVFIGPNNHLIELLYAGAWSHNDLTADAGAANFPAASGSALAGYTTNFNQQQHVNYVGFDGHVHELVYDGAWKHNDLTQLTGSPSAAAGSALNSYSTEFNQQQHVHYIGSDGNVHELYYDGSWKHNNLTAITNAPLPQLNAGLGGYVTNFNAQQHVNYIGTDNRVHELYYDGSWKHNDLNAASGSTAFPKATSALAGYATEFNQQQHVIYADVINHLDELVYTSQWGFNDLINATVHGALSDAWVLATGMWTVPAVSQPDLPSGAGGGWISSSWVGIDGSGSNDVLQAGIEQQFDGGAQYTAWYEWYAPSQDGSPDYVDQTNISNFPVSAGDSILCNIAYINNQTMGSVFLANLTSGIFFSIELDPPPGAAFLGNSIEWIVETPTFDGQYSALPAFSEVKFTAATGLNLNGVSGNPQNGSIATIFKNDVALTSTTLGDVSVTIDYLPWHALDITVEAAGPAAAGNTLDGYVTDYNQQLHINYVAADNHVHELFYDNGWQHNDLTQQGAAPAAILGSALCGFSTEFNSQQHVHFMGEDLHVHELVYDNGWQHNDLTLLAAAPGAVAGTPLDGYATGYNQQQHINYIGTDNHVHELYYDGSWKHNDLTLLAGAPGTANAALDGYSTEFNQQQHVNFIGSDSHVHELYYDGSWKHNDLTQLSGAPAAAAGSPLDGYATSFNEQQHVNFVGNDARVYELVYDNGWRFNDLLAAAGVSNLTVAPGSKLDGFSTEFNNQQHVHFVGSDGHIHELWYSDAWRHNDLTVLSNAPSPLAGSARAGFVSSYNQQQHLVYLDGSSHVIELMY